MADGEAILLFDPDPTSQKLIAGAFNRAGLVCRFIRETKKVAGAIRMLRPSLLIVQARPGTPPFKEVLDAIASDISFASLPVVVLSQDSADDRFVRKFRTGIVAFFALPFGSGQVEQIRQLRGELSERSGRLVGHGDRAELTALVDHLRRTQRSGVLMVDPMTPEEGKAFFAHGVLRSAEHGARSGSAALASMLARPQARWTFAEVGAEDENAPVVIDVGGDEPLSSAEDVIEDGISLEIEAPISEEYLLDEIVEEPPVSAPHPGAPTPILLVDDDPELCRMFGLYFKKNGFAVTTAGDGLDGFDQALKGSFEAIVADLNMPRMDGWGFLRKLREDFLTREMPVAFLSCHDDYRESLKALDAGAQAYFSKSTKLDSLALQIREVLFPRTNFRLAASQGQDFTASLSQVGPQWALRELVRSGASGRLDAKDSWASYQLFFAERKLVHAKAQSGRHLAEGERALKNYIASRGAEGNVCFGAFASPQSITVSLDEAVGRAAKALNDNERNLRDGLMVAGKEILVNAELYELYSQVGPKHWLEAARLLCEQKLTPKEVLARATLSPIEVEEAMRDLIRRGVVRLTA